MGHKSQREFAVGRGAKLASNSLALGIGLTLLAMIVVWGLRQSSPPANFKVIVGAKDAIYCSHAATKEDAQALGHALRSMGFFNDRGSSVLLSKGRAGTVVSFFVNGGAWDHPDTVSNFEEIGRRIAAPLGGFPIKVRLMDSAGVMRKEAAVGRAIIGAKDEIYYFGSATEADAEALGQALKTAGFLLDRGASVVLSKGGGTTISFVVNENAWKRPETVAAFERLARQAAASIGGLPIKLRLLDSEMATKREVAVQ